jgi:hypothetical protein
MSVLRHVRSADRHHVPDIAPIMPNASAGSLAFCAGIGIGAA